MESLRGRLLIAGPSLQDPNFRRTVVLIASHDDEGAMGVVLNRPTPVTVGDAVPRLGRLAGEEARVFAGGPVQPSSVIVLAEFEDPARAGLVVAGDVGFLPADLDLDLDADLELGLRRVRVFAGHAGWGPDQLEAELEEEAWFTGDTLADEIFSPDAEGLWAAALERKGGPYTLLARLPDDPRVN